MCVCACVLCYVCVCVVVCRRIVGGLCACVLYVHVWLCGCECVCVCCWLVGWLTSGACGMFPRVVDVLCLRVCLVWCVCVFWVCVVWRAVLPRDVLCRCVLCVGVVWCVGSALGVPCCVVLCYVVRQCGVP